MAIRNLTLVLPLVVALAAGDQPAAADDDQGFYLGGAYGQSELRDVCGGDLEFVTSCDDSDEGWKAFAGYRFHRNVAGEIAWVDLGSARAVLSDEEFDLTARYSVDGFTASVLGILPVGERFELFGKAGAFDWDVDTGIEDEIFFFDESTGDGWLLGVGANLNLGDHFGVRAEWERYFDVGDAEITGETEIDFLSLGAVVRF